MDKNFGKIRTFIQGHPLTVLGTADEAGEPHGAVVYICVDDEQPVVYFLTKTGTRKYQNLSAHNTVSLTSFGAEENSTFQANGQTFLVEDASLLDEIMHKLTEINARNTEWLPPLSKLRAGPYSVVGVRLTSARLAEFQGEAIGSKHIFTGGQ